MEKISENEKLPRPPVVVVVGHVDHGKTSLLDYIRKTNVAEREAGQITQSIGAYEVIHPSTGSGQAAKKITFIDTPGHEAFAKMRSRGATIADLAVLVVAADEGVKPQTSEAIEILKKTETPFVVALTKVDKPSANIDRVKNELLTAGVLLEGYGGDISYEPTSVVNGEGIEKLLDLILLASEVSGLTWNRPNHANGFVLEAFKDSRRGITVHLILKDGVLKEGEQIATRTAFGKIRTLENFLGERVKELEPSSPASILGFETMPEVGEEFWAGEVNLVEVKVAEKIISPVEAVGEERVGAVLRADTAGSLEVLSHVLQPLVVIKDAAVGEITDGDIQLAISTKSIVVGFKVKTTKPAENLSQIHSVKIFTSPIIYDLVESVEKFLKASQAPEILGELQILKVFSSRGGSATGGDETEGRQIVGGRVVSGSMKTGSEVQIERNNRVLGTGKIINLQDNRKDVPEVPAGKECGILIESDVKINSGDVLKAQTV